MLAAASRALELVDADTEPLRASRLLIDWSEASEEEGTIDSVEQVAAARRAVELTRPYPDTKEYVHALANLSDREYWTGDIRAAKDHARHALQAARRSGSNEAMSEGYRALGFAFLREARSDHDTKACLRYAHLGNDPWTIGWAFIVRENYLWERGRLEEFTEITAGGLRFAIGSGALTVAAIQAAFLTHALFALGRIVDSRAMVREGLSHTGIPGAGAAVRLSAAPVGGSHRRPRRG